MPARGPLGGGPGPGVARKYSCNFLKVLQRVRASGRCRQGASPRPPAPPWTRSRHRVPGTGPRGRLGVHRPRRGAAGREPGASAPARSRPHGKNDQATIKTREATMRCAAAPCYRHGRRRRARGPGPPVGAQVNIKLNSPGPHPQAHRMGRRQGRQAQAPAGRPPHPLDRLPAADALTNGRPEGRIDRLPQPAQSGRRPRPRRRRLRPAGVGRTRRRVGPRAAGGRGVVRMGLLGWSGAGTCPNLLQRRPGPGSAENKSPEYQRFSSGAPARSGPLQQIWTTDPPVD